MSYYEFYSLPIEIASKPMSDYNLYLLCSTLFSRLFLLSPHLIHCFQGSHLLQNQVQTFGTDIRGFVHSNFGYQTVLNSHYSCVWAFVLESFCITSSWFLPFVLWSDQCLWLEWPSQILSHFSRARFNALTSMNLIFLTFKTEWNFLS